MWFIPLLIVAALALSSAASRPSRPSRDLTAASRQFPRSRVAGGPPDVPGPIAVLGEFLRRGEYPPPMVILCAIAEAQATGRGDLASDIVSTFVAPVVHQHQAIQQGAPGNCAPAYERGSCAPRPGSSRSPREQAVASNCTGRSAAQPATCAQPAAPVAASTAPGAPVATEDEIFAMLHSDPKAFLNMVTAQSQRRGPLVEIFPRGSRPPGDLETMPAPSPSVQETQPTGQMQEATGLYQAADQAQALGPGSPLAGVPDEAWRYFVSLLAREAPSFSSSRHVGQYRQRRERLAEFGVDPQVLLGSVAAQRLALDTDLADAHAHAAAGGVLAEHLGRPIAVPGQEGAAPITLSGVLGVIQCAGLEGAVSWLESPNDRKRYPHTTQSFIRTNGVF